MSPSHNNQLTLIFKAISPINNDLHNSLLTSSCIELEAAYK